MTENPTTNVPTGAGAQAGNGTAGPRRLQIVAVNHAPIAPPSKARWATSEFACPSRLRVVGCATRAEAGQPFDNDKRRRIDRHEGKIMNRMDSFLHSISRFVFGLGVGFALTSTYVIVSSGPDLLRTTSAVEVVRLDPVEVTISARRFAEIRAEEDAPTRSVHVYGAGPKRV